MDEKELREMTAADLAKTVSGFSTTEEIAQLAKAVSGFSTTEEIMSAMEEMGKRLTKLGDTMSKIKMPSFPPPAMPAGKLTHLCSPPGSGFYGAVWQCPTCHQPWMRPSMIDGKWGTISGQQFADLQTGVTVTEKTIFDEIGNFGDC